MASVVQTATSGKPTTASSYERVSTLIQGRFGYSLGAQEKDARQFCTDRGWILPDDLIFKDGEDRNASGKDWDLPALNAMLDAAKAGRFQVLVVPSPNRFARNMVKAMTLEQQLRRYGVQVIYQNIPIEEDNAEARLLKNQLHSFSEYDREQIAFRTWRGRREKAEQGIYVGSEPCPYGYRFKRELERNGKKRVTGIESDEATAPIVRRIYEAAPKTAMNQIALALNREHIPAPRGGHWTYCTIRAILRNPMYKGVKTWKRDRTQTAAGNDRRGDYGTGIVIPCGALVTDEQWQAAQKGLDERREFGLRAARKRQDFELRGILFCGECGGSLTCRVITDRYRYYQCGSHRPSDAEKRGKAVCPLPAVPARDVEEHVKNVVTAAFLDPERIQEMIRSTQEERDAADRPRQERLDIIAKDIATRRRKLDRITAELLDADDESEAYASLKRTQATLDKELQQFKAEQKTLDAQRPKGLTVEQALTLQEAAGRIKANISEATSEKLQAIYSLLDLRGRVRFDEEHGLPMGNYRFTVDWQALIPLARSQNILLKKYSP